MKSAVVRWFALGVGVLFATAVFGQRPEPYLSDHPAIDYVARPTTDPIALLNRRIAEGQTQLRFEPGLGYLRSLLATLNIPVESQQLVFSKTSLQADLIEQSNPRALFFNDNAYVGWVNGTDELEVATQDPQQGVIFYLLHQKQTDKPQFTRAQECVQCHLTENFTRGVPGTFVMSMLPLSDDPADYAQGWGSDHRTPIADRFGGWYVTGQRVAVRHMGNVPVYHAPKSFVRTVPPALTSVKGAFEDDSRFLSPYSDIAALMVMHHQVQATNLLTRLNWISRIRDYGSSPPATIPTRNISIKTDSDVQEAVVELVDYLLFVDEIPLTSKLEGSARFAETFKTVGPSDSKGRSFRELDLERRVLRYPCSYMIYTEAFDALPPRARNAVYERMWSILSGRESDPAYRRMALVDRQAIVEILRETKKGLPDYFNGPIS